MTAQATPIQTKIAAASGDTAGLGRGLERAVLAAVVLGVAVIASVTVRAGIPLSLAGHALAVLELLVGGSLIVAARRQEYDQRRAWLTIGAGVVAAGFGQLLRAVFASGSSVGSVPDAFSIVFFGLVCVGLIRMPHVRSDRMGSFRMAMDVFVSMAAMTAVLWEIQHDMFDGGVLAPTMHVLLLGCMFVAFLRRSLFVRDVRLGLVLVGLLPIVSTVELGATASSAWSIVRWSLGMILMAAAAWALNRPQARRSMVLARAGTKQFIIPALPVAALGLVLAGRVIGGLELGRTVIPWSILLVSAGLAARSAVAIVENRNLMAKERDQLLASISRDLRTPLTAVSGFSHVLATSWDTIDDAERRELIEVIGSEADSLVDIVGDMNALARSELDAAQLSLERVQGKELIAAAIRLVFDLDGPLPIRAEVEPYLELICDRRRVVQVLRAMFENALRYGNGKILVVAKRTKTGRVIEVHDDGSGVEGRYENVIWKRFERGEHALNTNVPGSGLGLAIVRAIARAHQGEAHYRRSERLGGACFSIELPYDKATDLRRSGG